MNILHVFDFFSPAGGGTVDLIYKLASAQAKLEHHVEILTSDYKLNKYFIHSLQGVRVWAPHCKSSIGGFYFTPDVVEFVKDDIGAYHVIHLHCMRSYQNTVIHKYAKGYGVPYVLDTHGSLPRSPGGNSSAPKVALKWLYDVAWGYWILKDASKVIAETHLGIKEYTEFGVSKERIALCPPPFPVEAFATLPPPGLFRKQYHLEDKKIVMFLGRIHYIKGLDILAEGFAELAKHRNDIQLVIVGNDDGYKTILEAFIRALGISDKVTFTGFKGGIDKLSALVDADVVVQTSRYEQGAWAPFEAVLCGTPIVVSDNSGAAEDVIRADAGYLAEFGEKEDLAQVLDWVLNHPSEAKTLTLKAREWIRNNLSMDKGVERYLEVYREVAKK